MGQEDARRGTCAGHSRLVGKSFAGVSEASFPRMFEIVLGY